MQQWIITQSGIFHIVFFMVLVLIGFSTSFKQVKPDMSVVKSSLGVVLCSYVIFPISLLILNTMIHLSTITMIALLLSTIFTGGRLAFISIGVFRLSIKHAFWQIICVRILSLMLAPSVFVFYVQVIEPQFVFTLLNFNNMEFLFLDSFFILLLPMLIGMTGAYFFSNYLKRERLKILQYAGISTLLLFSGSWIYKVSLLLVTNWRLEFLWGIICNIMLLSITYTLTRYLLKQNKKIAFTSALTATSCNYLLIMMMLKSFGELSDDLYIIASLWSWTNLVITGIVMLRKKLFLTHSTNTHENYHTLANAKSTMSQKEVISQRH